MFLTQQYIINCCLKNEIFHYYFFGNYCKKNFFFNCHNLSKNVIFTFTISLCISISNFFFYTYYNKYQLGWLKFTRAIKMTHMYNLKLNYFGTPNINKNQTSGSLTCHANIKQTNSTSLCICHCTIYCTNPKLLKMKNEKKTIWVFFFQLYGKI